MAAAPKSHRESNGRDASAPATLQSDAVFEARLGSAADDPVVAAPANQTLLASAATAGFALPSSCRNGTCRACLCRILSGTVTYRIEWPGVSAEEKRDGFILPCVAYPATDVVLDWDV
jgi:ferredoxin